MTVRLYHWEPNANSGKPMLTLAEKGVEFESHYLDLLKFDQHQPEYLKINPTAPPSHGPQSRWTESTPMMEYVDDAFSGPPLKPSDPKERWRMRWWMRFFDSYYAPSLSMMAGVRSLPAVRQRPKEELEAAIARIPLESRCIAWRKAMFNEFSEAELNESRRRVLFCTAYWKITSRVTNGSPGPAIPWATSTDSISGMRCRCRSPITAMTARRHASWNGCAASTNAPPRKRSGHWDVPRWHSA